MFKKNGFLTLSVLLHMIVMYVVAQSVMFPSVPDSPAENPHIIQATLIFDLPTEVAQPPVEIIQEDTPLPPEPEEAFEVAATAPDNSIESNAEPATHTALVSPQPETLPRIPKEEEKEQEPKQDDEVNDIKITAQTMSPTPSLEISAPATNMARRHLNSFQQQQRNKAAEQASRYYQQHKDSPVINDDVKNPFITEDERFRGSLKVRADCSSTSKKTAAVVLGFLGGNIDCSKPPSIKGFIQKRLNKNSDIPGQYRQEDTTRPQSVVIKKQP